MPKLELLIPAQGSRVVRDGDQVVLFGQPPEVLKGILVNDIHSINTMVLTDIKEKDGSLLNNLEFPMYFFLFVLDGLSTAQRLNLVGEEKDISHALRLLRITLLGPTANELDEWNTEPSLKREWLEVGKAMALKDEQNEILQVEDFFNLCPFKDGEAKTDHFTIHHTGQDAYQVSVNGEQISIDLSQDKSINPIYQVQPDHVPGGLVKLGLEVLGGASGFTPNEPCTGLALCYNGEYILIDSIPFLDQHLFARGISKNQISAVFLTHLHDDHCAMFPLMLMPHKVEVITTKEIFHMAMEKLALGLGWEARVVAEHFDLIEAIPGEELNYFGLNILPHLTVHSIPTIGATFSAIHQGYLRQLCVVGDNYTRDKILEMQQQGIVGDETVERLDKIYTERFSLLVADGGAGAIHGNPSDALTSEADRIVFVHVERLPNELDTTFSLASSGKRYTLIDGDSSVYTSQVNHYLNEWLGRSFPNRWIRSLLAGEEIHKYNSDDVIIVQGAESRGFVYLILTGYCDVVVHDGKRFTNLARLQAGDIIGEMAIITGDNIRNASVMARTPVSVCVFAEQTFGAFIRSEGISDQLQSRWELRPIISQLPQFREMTSTALGKIGFIANFEVLNKGETRQFDETAWYILVDGAVESDDGVHDPDSEFGWVPFAEAILGPVTCLEESRFIRFEREQMDQLRLELPQLNYYLRKQRVGQPSSRVDWLLDFVPTN